MTYPTMDLNAKLEKFRLAQETLSDLAQKAIDAENARAAQHRRMVRDMRDLLEQVSTLWLSLPETVQTELAPFANLNYRPAGFKVAEIPLNPDDHPTPGFLANS